MQSSAAYLDQLHDRLALVDRVVAKALGVSEVARIARIESRLRRYLEAKWNARKKEAVDTSARMARELKSAKSIAAAVERIMGKWAKDVTPRVRESTKEIYHLARIAGWKKANGQTGRSLAYNTENYTEVSKAKPKLRYVTIRAPRFDLVDSQAVRAMNAQQTLWIGEHYTQNVSQTIRTATRQSILEAGLDRRRAGMLMRERVGRELSSVRTPLGWHGSQAQYFEGLAANAATVARVQGQLRSFVDLGVTTYKISNPGDRRTCPRCNAMNGKVFTVSQGVQQMNSDIEAKTPGDVKGSHPWASAPKGISDKEVQKLSAGKPSREQSQALADKGLSLPPYHFRCRCTVDVSTSAGSFQRMSIGPKVRPPTMIPKPPPPLPRPAKAWKPAMGAMNAAAWAAGSRVGGKFYHPTSLKMTAIRQAGFRAIADRDNQHPGIYLTSVLASADKLAREMDGQVVATRVRVSNPIEVDSGFWKGKSRAKAHRRIYDLLPKGRKPNSASKGELSRAAQLAGYDAWYMDPKAGGTSEMRLFDPKNVVMVDPRGS